MKVTAAEINELRKITGAGMMDCKKALVEANGDHEAAIDFLRKKGQKMAAKRGDREAAEGVVIAKSTADNKSCVIIRLSCETDFVSKNEDFVSFATKIADIALENLPENLEALQALPFEGGVTVAEKILENIVKIGEKLEVSGYEKITADSVYAYIHPGNQVGSIIGMNKSGDQAAEIAKELALQVVAMAPIALDKEGVPADVVERELQVGKEQALEQGKPEAMVEKIAMGKLNKYFSEVTLLNQAYINDGKKSVKQYLSEVDSDLNIKDFKRFSLS